MKNVVIMFGGKSTEHDISILSAFQAIKVIKNSHNILPIYINKNNDFYLVNSLDTNEFKDFDCKKHKRVIFVDKNLYYIKKNKLKLINSIDVVIPILHGKNGEDGSIQGMMELLNIPYVSSGIIGSALTLDKVYTKLILKNTNINIVDYEVIHVEENYNIEKIVERLGFPLIVKPSSLGSSIGITKANNMEELDKAIDLGFMFDNKLLIEKCLEDFKEYNISVLKSSKGIETSLIERPLSNKDILTFNDKYKTKSGKGMESLSRIFPVEVEDEIRNTIEEFAKQSYKLFSLNSVVRIDFLEKDSKVYLNEINTIPGSMAYYLWKDKYSFSEMLNELIDESIKSYNEKNKLLSSFNESVL